MMLTLCEQPGQCCSQGSRAEISAFVSKVSGPGFGFVIVRLPLQKGISVVCGASCCGCRESR